MFSSLVFLFFSCSRLGWRYKVFGLIRWVHSFGDLSTSYFKFLSSNSASGFSLLSQILENLTLVNTLKAKWLLTFFFVWMCEKQKSLGLDNAMRSLCVCVCVCALTVETLHESSGLLECSVSLTLNFKFRQGV